MYKIQCMTTARYIANILFHISRVAAILLSSVVIYALIVILLSLYSHASWLPMEVTGNRFQIFYPFTKKTFLLGDYTASYLVTNFVTIAFYGLFLWFLSRVFHAFRLKKLFTTRSVNWLSRFYMTNLIAPFLFLIVLAIWPEESSDMIRIIFLHLVIGIFAFFMAAIFKQGLLLQEEQDLTF